MKVSIIIPYQNETIYMDDCLDSLEEQTCKAFEAIVVCDRSGEAALEKLRQKSVSFPIKIVLLSGGHGVAAARNAGIRAAKGEFLLFLDCDDYLERTAVESLLERSEGKDVVYGRNRRTWYGRTVFYDNGERLDEVNTASMENERDEEKETGEKEEYLVAISEEEEWERVFCHLIKRNYMITGISVLGILYRREFICSNMFYFDEDYIYFTDLPYLVRVMCATRKVGEVRGILYRKRKHNDPIHLPSLSQIEDEKTKCKEALRAYWDMKQNLRGCSDKAETALDDKFIRYYVKKVAPFYLHYPVREEVDEIYYLAGQCLDELSPHAGRHAMRYSKRLIRYSRKHTARQIAGKVRRHSFFQTLCRSIRSKSACKKCLYRKLFARLKLKKNLVVFESFLGRNYSDSPRAVFEYLSKHYPGKYDCIWILNRREKLPYPAKRVKRFTVSYFYYLARAGYFVFNGRQPKYFIKRKGSVFLETWHGTPLKKLVFDMGEVTSAAPLYKRDVYIQSRSWDYLIAPNAFSDEIFRRCFQYEGHMLRTGYPRNDILHMEESGTRALVSEIKAEFGIPENKKVILYAPTWRDDEFYGAGQYKFTLQLDLARMRQELANEFVLLLRTHYFIVDSFDLDAYKGFAYDGSRYGDISRLYLISDILITDYSSVFFDFANLRRPMLFFTYDLDKYRSVLRGFYMNVEEELPGPLLFTTEQIIEAVRNLSDVKEKYREKYEIFYEKYCAWEDGNATKRVVEKVFAEEEEH